MRGNLLQLIKEKVVVSIIQGWKELPTSGNFLLSLNIVSTLNPGYILTQLNAHDKDPNKLELSWAKLSPDLALHGGFRTKLCYFQPLVFSCRYGSHVLCFI